MNNKPHILLVDDDNDILFLMKEILESFSYKNRIATALDGIEAINFLRKEAPFADAPTPGLVMLDLNMPRMNGFDVLREMRSDPGLTSIPVVIMTASQRAEDRGRALAAGARDYITKPLSYSELTEALQRVSQGLRMAN